MKTKQILALLKLPETLTNKVKAGLINSAYAMSLHPQPTTKEIPLDFILANWQSVKAEATKIAMQRNRKYEKEWCDNNTNGNFAYNNITDYF